MSGLRFTTFHLLIIIYIFLLLQYCSNATKVSHDGRAITIDGQRRLLISGSIHYPRSTPAMWPDLIKKAKEGGVDAIETYVFWNAHEPFRRHYDFSGNLDLIKFIKTIQDHGLFAILRIGPYVCAEWNYGGFPLWLHNMRGIDILRTTNTLFMNEMRNFTKLIVDKVKQEKLFASQGGPIILSQVENEYGNVMTSYGDAAKPYIEWCAEMADSLDIGVPWIMCQQHDAPQPMIDTCNGWYCDKFTPNNPMWTENWTGWFKTWGGSDPLRTAEDLAYATARFFQFGGTFNNYYMYHGGTNFGRTAGGPYIITSYDYNAPLDEYGNLNQPKYGHLKELHDVLHSMENLLTNGNVSHTDMGDSISVTVYRTNDGGCGCFLSNTNIRKDANVSFEGAIYDVPAWSVSILSDCKNEAYNTAKVNTETWVMEKKKNQVKNERPEALKWAWRPENIDDTIVRGKGEKTACKLFDQKVANDVSDYLWYMTSVKLGKNDPIWSNNNMRLRVNCTGQVLHAFVNGNYIGKQYATTYGTYHYVFEKKIKLKRGMNQITLLSATMGFRHYGAKFDVTATGVPGPVEIIGKKGNQKVIKDLSFNKWSYKAGLDSVDRYNKLIDINSSVWRYNQLPTQRKMTWYKTTFKAPLGRDPVSLDLEGLGKGHAWVNGNSIGRYWPSNIAHDTNCSEKACDYRGKYDNTKCVRHCGIPTQRWYHVPRSFLMEDGENELVLFEEFGGNPYFVNFQTVTVGTTCGNAFENKTMELSCNQDTTISEIRFASYGDVQGTCGSFQKGTCQETNDAMDIIKKECIGKNKCMVTANEALFGSLNCQGLKKKLVAEAVC